MFAKKNKQKRIRKKKEHKNKRDEKKIDYVENLNFNLKIIPPLVRSPSHRICRRRSRRA